MISTTTNTKTAKGFTAIELIFYILGMSIIISAIFYLIINLHSLYKQINTHSKIDTEAVIILSKISKDLRGSSNVNSQNSILNSNNGRIAMTKIIDGTPFEIIYVLDGGRIILQDNQSSSFITPDDLNISKLIFYHFKSPISEAVQINLEISFKNISGDVLTKKYRSFVILKNSYEFSE